ncbi:MAG: preprotein translocase subunit SecA [Candidatus Hatepunaea meridiana]|nr:preprotein translocase subunit SecA [Candidatus Hatepunaea meridiana]
MTPLPQFITSLFGSKKGRQLKNIEPFVDKISEKFEHYKATLSDDDFPRITEELRQRYKSGETLDDLLPEAFALVKDVCRRLLGKKWDVVNQPTVWDMVPYDVQLIGGIVLHQGKITEMATGEGKTLVATMPLYLNSLAGKGVHLITVNDYLAQRDSEWMGGVFEFLGVSVGCILNDMSPDERKKSYNCDITYGTNNEFGFDYLRDNMATHMDEIVQRKHFYAIVDEVDSVLIDEARTPLIISGPVGKSTMLYDKLKPSVDMLVRAQRVRVNKLVARAEELIEEDNEENNYEIGKLFLKSYRSYPKHNRLTKLLSETGYKSLMRQVENSYIRDKKLHELDEELLYAIDERQHSIDLTDEGRELLARNEGGDSELFLLPDLSEEHHLIDQNEDISDKEKTIAKDKLSTTFAERSEKIHNISQLLKAYSLYEKDNEYVLQDDKVLIVDEFTGRIMQGRRYSDGLHQAIEAKEGVKIEGETQTVATITLQNYFRLYDKLAGMTGTAETEEGEFWDIYKLEVMVIPTNDTIRRIDQEDVIFRTKREKYNAITDEIKALNEDRLPVLVGTTSVEVSETLARLLKRRGVKHSVLNAKHHKNEAEIIKYAGQPGAVTIATNMAGRGTDIKLGQSVVRWEGKEGDKENAIGGLQILGTERHESRRIDRQLRGRSGRQGDPGGSMFYLSLEDDLMRLFGSERIAKVMDRMGVKEGDVITHSMITKSIEKAQKRVEAYNFSIRKHLLEYDDVMNQQREVVYQRRRAILFDEDIREIAEEMAGEYIDTLLATYADERSTPDMWNQEELKQKLFRILQLSPPPNDKWGELSKPDEWYDYLLKEALDGFGRRRELYGVERFDMFVRWVVLRSVDDKWKDHLYDMDRLKEGVGLRAYGQKDPLIEYKREGFDMFSKMLDATNEDALRIMYNSVIQEPQHRRSRQSSGLSFVHDEASAPTQRDISDDQSASGRSRKKQPIRVEKKIGRNDPCPCDSGKKYKHCCGR